MKGSTNQIYKVFKVMPLRLAYKKKIAINCVNVNRKMWFNTEMYNNKRQFRNLDAKVNHVKTTCGQQCRLSWTCYI